MYLKAFPYNFASLAHSFAKPIIRDHPLGILHPAKIALSLQITLCFGAQALQDRIFFSNPQLSDGDFAVPLAQISVKGLSQGRVSPKKEKKIEPQYP